MNIKIYFLFCCFAPSFLLAHFYTPERVAFPALCEKHYTDPRKYTTHTWIEPIDSSLLTEFMPYLKYLPKPYEADCQGCTGCGGMRLSRRDEFRLPFENPKFAYDELGKLHQQVRYGTIETCRHRGSDRCDGFCWDGAYFRRLNCQYLPFFKEFLIYSSQNPLCKCFWHERYEKAVEINNHVYRFLHNLVEQKLIQSDFSPYWVSQEIKFDRKGRTYGKEYFPNSHGMASSLTTYMFFYSHYQKLLRDLVVSIERHASNPLQVIVAKDQVYLTLEELHEKFMPLYTHCLTIHPHPKIYLERSFLKMQVGKPAQALEDLLSMQHLSQTEKFKTFNWDADLHFGETYAALGQYEKAIEFYNRAIEKNEEEALFLRAAAHFELGNYQAAQEDYRLSGKGALLAVVLRKTSDDYREALLKGLKLGAAESQRSVWAIQDLQVEAAQLFANACEEIGRAFSQPEGMPVEATQLLETYSQLSDSEKAERLGILLGKYGVLLFSEGKRIKQMEAFKKLQEANYICNLEGHEFYDKK